MATPVIKGIFVNSHIKAVFKALGEAGVKELERRYGKPIVFRNRDLVPVRDEVKIIELALDLLRPGSVSAEERAFEAGRLHFQNFRETPYGRIMFSTFAKNEKHFKRMVLNSMYVAQHVFQNVQFTSYDLAPRQVKIVMANNDYPLDHFRGLFYEWLHFFKLKGTVEGKQTTDNIYEYLITWQ